MTKILSNKFSKKYLKNFFLTKMDANYQNDNLVYNFELKLKCKYHTGEIFCLIVLNDGRFATCSMDKSIIIYNQKTCKPDLIIKEDNYTVIDIMQLNSGMLASSSTDNTIKIFNIKNNNYKILQTLNEHNTLAYYLIELNNKKLVSCSIGFSIIIYSKDNKDKYKKDQHIKLKKQIEGMNRCICVIETKDNEICYAELYDSICFYDLLKRKVIKKINNIKSSKMKNSFNMITKDLLLITGNEKLYIINVHQHILVRIVNVPGSSMIYFSCVLNQNNILTGDCIHNIKQWRIEGNNLKLISTKNITHGKCMFQMIKLRDGHILSGSIGDFGIKIWKYYLRE